MLQNSPTTNFRYDINALRAIAIIGVVLYHFKLIVFEGGFTGVDVFFVISGYLMSRIILNRIDNRTFSFSNYFEKRLFRIVPALLFLIAVLTVICFFIYLPNDYRANLKNAESSIVFLSNAFYWKNTPSYFGTVADTNMYLHTWSLSTEWQFYLVYPFLLLLLNSIFPNRKVFKFVFIALTLLLFVMSVIFTHYKESFSFYMLPARAWEMLFGGIAFFAEGKIVNKLWQKAFSLLGYILILCCFIMIKESMLWPGIYTLIPILGAFLVIVANYSNFIVIRHATLQFIGKISYSLYLWHWPVYVISQYYGLGTGFIEVALYCALSVTLGYASYRYIESIQFTRKRIIAACMLVLFATAFGLNYFNANKILYDNKTLIIANNTGIKLKPFYNQYRKDTCFAESMHIYKKSPCLCFEKDKKNILLIGDSHLAQLSQSFGEEFSNTNIHFLQATAPGTLPTIKSYYDKKINLRELMDYIFHDFIPKHASMIDGVIISGNWAAQNTIEQENLLVGINEAVSYLKQYNIPAVVIGQTERYTVPYPIVAAREHYHKSNNYKFYLDTHTLEINNYLRDNLKDVYVNVLNENSVPPLSARNVTYMRDKDHVTKYGADLLVTKIKKDIVWQRFIKTLNK